MNLLGGMQALANFGTGYFQGQQTSIQNAALNQHNQLANQALQTQQDQAKLSQQQQQALSDKAIELFNPAGEQPAGGKAPPPATMPGSSTPMADTNQATQADPTKKLSELANFAASKGDLTHANELWTNAANLQNAQLAQQQKQAAMQVGELKRQQMHYGLAAQYASTLDRTPEGLNKWKMAMLSDPSASPQERQYIANMPYTPDWKDKVMQAGMTASQQAASKLDQQKFAEKQRIDQADQLRKNMQLQERTAHDRAIEEYHRAQIKVGAATHAPTSEDITVATPIVREALGLAPEEKFPNLPTAVNSIAARALQITKTNTAISNYAQAVHIAAEEAKQMGNLSPSKTVDTHTSIFGIPYTSSTTTAPSFQDKGNTPEQPITIHAGLKDSDIHDGMYYSYGGKTYQGKDHKLFPVQ